MNRCNVPPVVLFAAGAAAIAAATIAGCLQSYDPQTASGVGAATASDAGPGTTGCPPGQVCSDPATTQCTLDSPECFYLCGSPLCALGHDPDNPDAGAPIPQATDVPPIYLGSTDSLVEADGSTATDPCVQTEMDSVIIRQRSCAPCHTATGGNSAVCACTLNFILDDSQLTTKSSPDFTNADGIPAQYVVPGDPADSLIYERAASGQMPPPATQLSQIGLAQDAAAALVYPTASDLSVLYGWIQNCVQGADGGAYSTAYYGGGLNGSPCFGVCGEGGASDAGTD
jgi:hypothetical protein